MWKSKVRAILSVSHVGAWTGLLVDFEDAATRVGSMFPLIDALLPIVALSGTAGGVAWLLFEAWTWHPSYRRGQRLKQYAALLEYIRSTLAADILSDPSKVLRAHNRILEAKMTLEEQFEIPCPGLETPVTMTETEVLSIWIDGWSTFAAVLLPRVRSGNWKNARRAIHDINVPIVPMAQWGKSRAGAGGMI